MKLKLKHVTVICVLALCFLLPAAQGRASVNIGTANLGADPGSPDNDFIKDSGSLSINSTNLAVIEKAFLDDNDGTEVTSGSTVIKGTIIKFVIYIDNTTASQASDVRLVNLLDEVAFSYQAGSLKWNNNTTASSAPLATIFNDTNNGVMLTDAIGSADVGSADTTQTPNDRITFGAVTDQANATLNIPAGKIAAFMFRARAN